MGTPRFLKAGQSNRIIVSGPCMIESIVLSAKAGAVSLSLYNTATSTINATTIFNRLWFRKTGAASGADSTATYMLGETLFITGITVSLNGAGGLATLNIRNAPGSR